MDNETLGLSVIFVIDLSTSLNAIFLIDLSIHSNHIFLEGLSIREYQDSEFFPDQLQNIIERCIGPQRLQM